MSSANEVATLSALPVTPLALTLNKAVSISLSHGIMHHLVIHLFSEVGFGTSFVFFLSVMMHVNLYVPLIEVKT